MLSLRDRFIALDRLLTQLRPFWQLRPFALKELPWHQHQSLHHWLQTLDLSACEALERDDQLRAENLASFIDAALPLHAHSQLPEAPTQEMAAYSASTDTLPARLSYHVPGRKWEQIRAFDQALRPAGEQWLEWCAGKGHLGRLLAFRHQRPVLSLEWQHTLCNQGQHLADALKLDCRMQPQDVMAPATTARLHPRQHAVALHACGKLHLRLLRLASEQRLAGVTLSPCCYHLIDEEHYHPLSDSARISRLQLSRQDLKLALQDTVTAGARERRLRQRELAWRLGFDLLQRQLRGEDSYLPCPSAPKSQLSGGFEDYCRWMAARKQLRLPDAIDYAEFEQQGRQRVLTVTRIELVRNLFRRPLELWLALDRALYLQERGYQVTLSEFCDYQLTPRNLLIQAIRRDEPAPPRAAGQ
ncbi:methyltransferase [Motiliproteus sediminis]|uniref:methyltransferase n=1 Tax=Motiliproteus sediminis TaxID=1468178 RepID=UPI001AEFC4C2